MAIKMTREEYEKKYGIAPTLGTTKPQVTQSTGGQVSNAFKSGVQQVKSGFNPSPSTDTPLQAMGNVFKGGTNIAAGAINAASAPLAPLFNPIGKLISKAGDALGNSPTLQKFAQSPAGQTTANIAETTGNLATIGGTVAGLAGAGKVASKGATLAKEATAPLAETTGRVLKSAGEGTYGLTVPPTEATAKALLAYDAKQPNLAGRIKNFLSGESEGTKPITEANTAARKGLAGTEYQIGVQAKKISNDLWNQEIQPKLAQIKGQVNMKDFFDQVEKTIVKDTKELGRRNALKEALASLREQYQNVGAPVNLEKLQQYKEGWAKFLPDSSYKGKPIGAALKEVQDVAARKAREVIYKHVGEEGRQAYLDYGNLQSIIESGAKSITGDAAKRSLGRNIWQGIMDKAVTPVATILGKVLYRTGEGLEFIGKSGAKKVEDIIGK